MIYGSKLLILAENLKKEILSDKFPVGSILPSIKNIRSQYGLSSNTVVGALKILIKENLITREGAARQGYRIIAKPEDFSSELLSTNKAIKFILPFTYWNFVGSKLIESFEKHFSQKHISLIFSNHQNSTHEEREIINRILDNNTIRLDALLLMSSASFDHPNLDLLKRISFKYPLVLIDRYVEGLDCHYVGVNNRQIGNNAAHYFMERGHKNFAFISGFSRVSTTNDRLHGFRQAIERHGYALPIERIIQEPSLFETYDSYTHSGEILGNTLLLQNKLPTAIYCGSDKIAAGLIHHLEMRKIKVPEDISVIGCDDDIIQQNSVGKKITTFAYPYKEISIEVLRIFNSINFGKKYPIRNIELNAKFIPGETVC